MKELWLSRADLMELTKWPVHAIQRKAKSGALRSRLTDKCIPNGRPVREYSSLSLPIDLQIELERRQLTSPIFCPKRKPDSVQLIPIREASAPTEAPIIALTQPQQEQANCRFEIIRPLIEFSKLSSGGEQRLWCLQNDRDVASLTQLVEQIANGVSKHPATIWEWCKRFKGGGINGLADPARADKGMSRWFQRHPDARMFAAYLYLVERMSVSFVCDQLEYEAQRLGIAGDLPARETVRTFLSRSISPAMKTYAREGKRAYHERMAPYLRRGYVDVYANQIWVGDHMIHDIEIANDVFDDVPIGTPGRLRLSAFVDYRSRKAWGTWAWEGSSRSIAATLVRGMLDAGPPEQIYVDNGKDYRKVAKGAQRGSEAFFDESALAPADWWSNEYDAIEKTGILARLGIAVTHCIPRHPQSKHVERFFRTLHERFDAAHATYTSGSPATRPAVTEAAMMRHRWLLKRGRAAESGHPLASQVILACLRWIEQYNNSAHTGEGMEGRTPNEVFEAERNPNQKPVPEPEKLALLLMDFTRRRVRECAVTLDKRRYTPRPGDRPAWAAMHEANETEIRVGHNGSNPEVAVALDGDGRFLAWLEAEAMSDFAPWDSTTRAQIGESMEIRGALEKATKQSLQVIAASARASGARSAQEMLYNRLQLPAAVESLVTQPRAKAKPAKKAVAPMTPDEVARMILDAPDTNAAAPASAAEIASDFLKNLEKLA